MSDPERTTTPGAPERERRFQHRIEAGVSISGRIHFPGDARIDGHLKGEVRADELLFIDVAAELDATVSARHMVLAGTMRGDVIRSGTVELESTARLVGNVEARNLVVRAGAFFDGQATIGKPPAADAAMRDRPGARTILTPRRRANG